MIACVNDINSTATVNGCVLRTTELSITATNGAKLKIKNKLGLDVTNGEKRKGDKKNVDPFHTIVGVKNFQ